MVSGGLQFALGEQAHAVARRRRSTPAATSAAPLTGASASSLPASSAVCSRPRLTTTEMLLEIGVVEAALGQAAMERHLAALEAVEGDAGARRLALAAAAAGLALARADAAADALGAVMRAGIVSDLVELHRSIVDSADYLTRPPHHAVSSSTRTRCLTLAIMPRTAGVSSSTRVRCSLLRPRPISVARWSPGGRSGCRSA